MGHVVYVRGEKCVESLFREPKEKRPLGRFRHRWEKILTFSTPELHICDTAQRGHSHSNI
jgi:hypothetical protein